MPPKVAVVTGANRGIGKGLVEALCKQFDGDVILTSRNESLGKAAVAELEKAGLKPKYHQLDIVDQASIDTIKKYLTDNYGGLDLLINNAAIFYDKLSIDPPLPLSERAGLHVDNNFTGTLKVCQSLLPILKPGARVVNMAGRTAHQALMTFSQAIREKITSPTITLDQIIALMKDYVSEAKAGRAKESGWLELDLPPIEPAWGVSKAGIVALTDILQRQLDSQGNNDILINAVCPGMVKTDMNDFEEGVSIARGISTPMYAALLPAGSDSPRGKFLGERKVIPWNADKDAALQVMDNVFMTYIGLG